MLRNYPNPFNAQTTISVDLPRDDRIQLSVYDVFGRRVTTLIDGALPAGDYRFAFDAGTLASGTYFYRLLSGSGDIVRSMTLVK
ncbi:MAG: T9SS type A sorting domain-containing protein [candidate division KSB1 bacterium]|nr:T9SS type A sorting domain-containing protein [candidate division KSB1 bacterium]MDZ7345450.1 T9SS type A sorting domain-containing protein [candidate division KSB1 bacterium]